MTLARATKILRRRLLWLERRVAHRPAEQGELKPEDTNDDGILAEIGALRAVLAMFAAPRGGPTT